jgi:hypothetical protein
MKKITNWFKRLAKVLDAGRDPLILSVRELTNDEIEWHGLDDYERFVFETDGKPYLRGSLTECMEARHSYASTCEQYGVFYAMTDLPEPHRSNLSDFYANPIVGGKP